MNKSPTALEQPSQFATALAVAAAASSLLGWPVHLAVASIETSLLEISTVVAFVFFFLLRKDAHRSPLFRAYAVVLASTIPALGLGLLQNPVSHVFRDLSQVIYISFAFVGFFAFAPAKPWRVIDLACRATFCCCCLIFADQVTFQTGIFGQLAYQLRPLAAFSFVALVARIIGVNTTSRISVPMALLMICAISAYAVGIRTRAFLLMLSVGAGVISLGGLSSRHTGVTTFRVFVVVGCTAYLAVLVAMALATFGVEVDLPKEGALRRSLSLAGDLKIDATMRYRIDAWRAVAPSSVSQWIIGHGFGAYLYLDPLLRGTPALLPVAMIHNTALQLLYLGGLLHVLAYLLLAFRALQSAGWQNHAPTPHEGWGVGLVVWAFVSGYIAYGVFSVTLFDVTSAVPFWLLVGHFCRLLHRGNVAEARSQHTPTLVERGRHFEGVPSITRRTL